MRIKLLAACAASALLATASNAALLMYQLNGLDSTGNVLGAGSGKFTATFTLDTSRAATTTLGDSVRYNGIPITYTLPTSTTPIFESGPNKGVTFSALINQGGFFYGFLDNASCCNNRIQVFGPQLYSGSTSAPNFLTGTFVLSTVGRTFTTDPVRADYQLAVTDVTAGAVPETATWAMIVGGFGLVGGTLRRRRVTVRFA